MATVIDVTVIRCVRWSECKAFLNCRYPDKTLICPIHGEVGRLVGRWRKERPEWRR